jgi:hypothetical protein
MMKNDSYQIYMQLGKLTFNVVSLQCCLCFHAIMYNPHNKIH